MTKFLSALETNASHAKRWFSFLLLGFLSPYLLLLHIEGY